MSLVGNTAMHHLFLELPVRQLAFSPYVPAVSNALEVPAATLGLGVLEQATVFLPASIAGYVGSDHLAAVLATRLHRRKGIRLLVDLGTNTEIALKAPDGITCCSCASGPAFEGGSLKHGMRAAAGAVEEVTIGEDGKPRFTTVGNADAAGSAAPARSRPWLPCARPASSTRAAGCSPAPPASPRNGAKRSSASPGVPAARGSRGWIGLSQADVRELQKAKGAVRAGIEMLLDHAGLAAGDIDEIILAGAFGNYLNPADVLEIAMLPPSPCIKSPRRATPRGWGRGRCSAPSGSGGKLRSWRARWVTSSWPPTPGPTCSSPPPCCWARRPCGPTCASGVSASDPARHSDAPASSLARGVTTEGLPV